MRPLLALLLIARLHAAESARPDAEPAVIDPPKPVNTVCPVQGDPVDRQVDVVVVDLVRDGKHVPVAVGLCCEDCRDDLRRDPQRYAAAALENRKAPKAKK